MTLQQRRLAFWGGLGALLAIFLLYAFRPQPVPVDFAEVKRGRLTVTIDEGQPVIVNAVLFSGFHVIPDDRVARLSRQAALEVGQPRDRQRVVATLDLAVNELREHGYPYARVKTDETALTGERAVRVTFVAEPGPLAHFGPVDIVGNQTVSRRVIERQLSFRPGQLYRRSAVQTFCWNFVP